MEVQEFIKLCLSRNIEFAYHIKLKLNDKRGEENCVLISRESYTKLANMTERIDFKCDFDNEGICAPKRSYLKAYTEAKKDHILRCCCYACYNCLGYLRSIPNVYSIIEFYAEHFLPEIGFWREGKGCILPRMLRSQTCLCYCCDSSKLDKVSLHLLNLIKWLKPLLPLTDLKNDNLISKELFEEKKKKSTYEQFHFLLYFFDENLPK